MNIAEIIRNGIPKIGTSFMSKTFYDYFHSTPKKFYQVIGYRDYYDELMVDFVTDDYKTLRLEHYTLNDLLSMNLEQGVPVLNKDSIKKINIKDKETNKFYLDMYGILYTHSDRYSLIVNGISFTVVEHGLSQLKGKNIVYEITDMEEVKKILEQQKIYYDEMLSFYFYDDTLFNELMKMSLNDLLNGTYIYSVSSFLMGRVITQKLLDIVIEKMSNKV